MWDAPKIRAHTISGICIREIPITKNIAVGNTAKTVALKYVISFTYKIQNM